MAAVRALAVWGGSENVPTLIKLLNGNDKSLRSDLIRTLGALGDERGAKAVAKQLPADRGNASQALIKMGQVAEPFVTPYLQDRDQGLRRSMQDSSRHRHAEIACAAGNAGRQRQRLRRSRGRPSASARSKRASDREMNPSRSAQSLARDCVFAKLPTSCAAPRQGRPQR